MNLKKLREESRIECTKSEKYPKLGTEHEFSPIQGDLKLKGKNLRFDSTHQDKQY